MDSQTTGILPAGDFGWDESHVGRYDPVQGTTMAASSAVPGAMAVSNAQSALGGHGPQGPYGTGGAPMLSTPNCES